jgi:hypothetical protein
MPLLPPAAAAAAEDGGGSAACRSVQEGGVRGGQMGALVEDNVKCADM